MESLKRAGEVERLSDHYRKYPKPPNYTEDEWNKEVARRLLRKLNPEVAPLAEELIRMNPEVTKTLENIIKEPAPEGVNWREWMDQQAQRAILLLHSGQLKLPPELKK